MGCDIRLIVEVKIEGTWYCWNQPNIVRDYYLFGYMAGVRKSELQLFDVKGLPDDMSIVTQKLYQNWEDDAHSMSWLCLDEIKRLQQHLTNVNHFDDCFGWNRVFGWFFGNDYYDYDFSNSKEGIEDVRFVFWFDN
jgi:hypothetical protein